jgi:hypothetical protein
MKVAETHYKEPMRRCVHSCWPGASIILHKIDKYQSHFEAGSREPGGK